jgi:hypothetical protein
MFTFGVVFFIIAQSALGAWRDYEIRELRKRVSLLDGKS